MVVVPKRRCSCSSSRVLLALRETRSSEGRGSEPLSLGEGQRSSAEAQTFDSSAQERLSGAFSCRPLVSSNFPKHGMESAYDAVGERYERENRAPR